MTKHVRSKYRRHRRATWGLATALVLAIAVVAIPIASGAPDKTYKLEFPITGPQAPPVTPVVITTGNNALLQRLCTDTTYSVKLTLTNTAPNAQLGSGDVRFPTSIGTLTGTPTFPGGAPNGAATVTRAPAPDGNVVRLRNLSLPKRTGTVTFAVTLNTGSSAVGAATDITAGMKQSNDFSDSGQNPDANAFDSPAAGFPKFTLQTCNATISGLVYHDRDQSGAFAINAASPTSDILKTGWTVALQRQTGATYTTIDTDTSDANGYEVEGPAGSNYRLCVTAPGDPDPDSDIAWAVRKVATTTLIGGCSQITPLSPDAAGSRGLSVAPLTAAGATVQDFAVVPVTVLDFEGGDTAGLNTDYVIVAGTGSNKDPAHYVRETFTSNGLPYFIFAPINECTAADCGQIYLLEHLKGRIAQSALGADKQVSLVYDDKEPFNDFKPMPFCLQDPRGTTPTALLTEGVLPEISPGVPATSCIVEGHQTVDGDGEPENAFVDVEFFVYSSYDGGRGMG